MKLTHQARNNIRHALEHLEANEIHKPDEVGGWYHGNKGQFIKRHKAAIEFFRELLSGKRKEGE